MATYHSQIQQLYVAYFNRPADVGGLEYWNKAVTAANGNLAAVSAAFAASPEFATRYAGMDGNDIWDQVFQNLFGRAFQSGGANDLVPNGPPAIDKIIQHFLDTAQGPDKTALSNKVAAAQGFTAAIDSPAELAGYTGATALHAVNTFMRSVTADASTLPTNFNNAIADVLGVPSTRSTLTAGLDVIRGADTGDTFAAPLINRAGTFQAGDFIDGGAGADRLNAELSDTTAAAQVLASTGLETVSIRAVASSADAATTAPGRAVLVAARGAAGVTQWESNRSNADLIIDGIRIQPTQVTRDITIVMESTDAGDVDFGVYFESDAVRGHTPNILDIGIINGQRYDPLTPLKDSPYYGFGFYFNGVLTEVTSPAMDAAETYEALFTATQAAVRAIPVLRNVSVTKGAPLAWGEGSVEIPKTWTRTVLTAPVGEELSMSTGAGWFAHGIPPAIGSQWVNPRLEKEQASATIILDDVGRGGASGDLVVGMPTPYSSVPGIARFEIEVRDTSKLQTISSTYDALREVVFRNGTTSAHGSGPANQGDLTVLGGAVPTSPASASDTLPHSSAQPSEYGFSDMLLIDASAMRGRVSFDAKISKEGLRKFEWTRLQKPAASETPDFAYSGGANDDTMKITIDGAVLATDLQEQASRGDFIFSANGGAGNDDIGIIVLDGKATEGPGVLLNGGAGNDTLRMEGVANAIIGFDAGPFGSDKVFGFTSGAGTGADQLDFRALGGRGAAFSGAAISNANGAITVQLQTAANDTATEIAALYADGAMDTRHVFIAYDVGNVGKVYTVVDGAASAVAVTLVGSIDLANTAWSGLIAANFA